MKFNIIQKLSFFVLFVCLGIVTLQVPLAHLAGSKASFTLFDAFAPIGGAFLGTLPGIVAVFLMQVVNFVIHGSKVLDTGTLIRFIPILFATMYFAKQSKLNLIISALAIIAFNLNPIGRSVWFYSLFWLIPIVCYFWQDRFLFARSLGATFTAHAVGGAIWIWAFHLPASVWIGLIPVVIIERLIFAFGISVNYLLVKQIIKTVKPKFKQYAIHQS